MSDRIFVDTNILVYARDSGAGDRHAQANTIMSELWAKRSGRISVQVLSEYFVTVTRKLKPGMSEPDAWSDVCALQAWNPWPTDVRLLELGRTIQLTHRLSWWDALLVAAAVRQDCSLLFSEDLAHGMQIDRLRIVNPFVA